jgi:glyoxylase-like metal-dependent hydrolase (beta-lactamase superfamily II)
MCISTLTPRPLQGHYAMQLGAFSIVALSDGEFELAADTLLIDRQPGDVRQRLAHARLPGTICSTVNAYLIDTGTARVLVDAGAGTLQGNGLGRLITHLRAAGYTPEDIDLVLLTHLHADHVGGIAQEERAVFPRAIVRVNQRELAFWSCGANAQLVDESVRASFDGAMASLRPYIAAGRLISFQPGERLAPGITAVALEGHTTGHTGFRIDSEKQCMVVCGDVLHVAAVQLADPGIAIRYDSAPAQACEARARLLADALAGRWWLAAAHAPFPGIGQVTQIGNGYAWAAVGAS